MDLKTLKDTAAWEWPPSAHRRILAVLTDGAAPEGDRLLAATLAGDTVVINDDLADALLSILRTDGASRELRTKAALSLGPILELADLDGFDEFSDVPISEATFRRIVGTLEKLYRQAAVPTAVRRRILEASVRAPQDWHPNAIAAAYASDDDDWKLTAVFSMRWVRGFDAQILEALDSDSELIHIEAVLAAGAWSIEAAWSHLASLVTAEDTDKDLRLAAIESVTAMRPGEAVRLFEQVGSSDEDILAAIDEASAMSEMLPETGLDDMSN